MTELIIDDFKLGLDVRRSVLTAPAGSLQTLDNCLINAGGEIEKRAAIIATTQLPAGQTFGCFGLNHQVHVWGYGAPPVIDQGTSPWPVIYHQLANPGGKTLWRILSAEAYQYKFLVVAQNTDGTVYNFWDGVQVYTGAPVGVGNFVHLYKSKMYRTTGPYLAFAGVGDPSVTDPASVSNPGAGFIDLSANDAQTEELAGMEAYYKQIAIFSRLTTQLWALDPDPSQDTLEQVLRIGAACPRSIVQFGTGDVLFVSDSGIRSLRAINASMAAAVNDVGSPIDKLLMADIRGIEAWSVCAVVTPISGRYIVAFGSHAYVLSYFPSAKISAWSRWTFPELWAEYLATVDNRVIIRWQDTLYMYGGPDGNTYDNTQATVVTPMMAAESPTLWKKPISIDLMIQGTWQLQAGMLANNPTARELVGTFNGETYSLMTIPYAGFGTHIGLTLTTTDPSAALLGSITVNFQKANLKGNGG